MRYYELHEGPGAAARERMTPAEKKAEQEKKEREAPLRALLGWRFNYRVDLLPNYQQMVKASKFEISHKKLGTLYGSPEKVEHAFNCASNKELDSLKYAPKWVGGDFTCSNTNITSLEYAPEHVGGNFMFDTVKMASLEGCPKYIGGEMYEQGGNLKSYAGGPDYVNKLVITAITPDCLKTMHSFFGEVHHLSLRYFGELTNLLSVFKIKGLQRFELYPMNDAITDEERRNIRAAAAIVTEYLPMGKKGMMLCAAQLTKAGFKHWANI